MPPNYQVFYVQSQLTFDNQTKIGSLKKGVDGLENYHLNISWTSSLSVSLDDFHLHLSIN